MHFFHTQGLKQILHENIPQTEEIRHNLIYIQMNRVNEHLCTI